MAGRSRRSPGKTGKTGTRTRDRGICLRRFPYGESSLVVHVLTHQGGRRSFLAKGAYRLKSRYFGVLDLFDTLELEWRASPGAELELLAEARIVTRRRALSTQLRRYHAALGVLELAGHAMPARSAEPALFELTEGFLDRITAARAAPELLALAHVLQLLRCMGLEPALEHCATCGRSAQPKGRPPAVPPGSETNGRTAAFAPQDGGRLCRACAAQARASGSVVQRLPLNVVRIAASLMEAPAEALDRVQLAPSLLRGVRGFVDHFLEHHLETRLRTRRTALR